MKTLFKKILCGAPFAIASIVSLNACSGENGVDGRDGKDGVSVTDTLYVVQKDTVIFSGDTIYINQKDTVLVKDTVILAGDTIVISKKDTVVVNNKDTVYIANGGAGTFGTLVDERDGQTYRTTKIGDQVWMAENLNYDCGEGSYCYDNNLVNCETYGRLYTWEAAQDVCPSGWHLPSEAEINVLFDIVGSKGERADKLKAKVGWRHNGMDLYDFSALPAGHYDSDVKKFYSRGSYAYFWHTEYRSYQGDLYNVLYIDDDSAYSRLCSEDDGSSVRCLKD